PGTVKRHEVAEGRPLRDACILRFQSLRVVGAGESYGASGGRRPKGRFRREVRSATTPTPASKAATTSKPTWPSVGISRVEGGGPISRRLSKWQTAVSAPGALTIERPIRHERAT